MPVITGIVVGNDVAYFMGSLDTNTVFPPAKYEIDITNPFCFKSPVIDLQTEANYCW